MKISDKAKRGLERIGFRVTGSRWAWTAAIGSIALWASAAHSPAPANPLPVPNPALPQIELGGVTTRLPAELVRTFLNKLPEPIKGQYRPPCETDMEREINGACWVPLDLNPCPKGKAWIHEGDGKCYVRAMRAPRTPNAGEPEAPRGVATPSDP